MKPCARCGRRQDAHPWGEFRYGILHHEFVFCWVYVRPAPLWLRALTRILGR